MKHLGHIKSLDLNIDAPLKMKTNIEMNSLNILVGVNGSGKSLILKLNWILGTIGASAIQLRGSDPKMLVEVAQFTFDKSFTEQNFNGNITCQFEEGQMMLILDKGKITSLIPLIPSDVTNGSTPIFMSTTMRLFTQISQYLKLSKLLINDEKILEHYMLYDLIYIKHLQHIIGTHYTAPQKLKDFLASFDLAKLEIESFQMNDENVYYTNTKGDQINLASLSNGEQALINMCVAQVL